MTHTGKHVLATFAALTLALFGVFMRWSGYPGVGWTMIALAIVGVVVNELQAYRDDRRDERLHRSV